MQKIVLFLMLVIGSSCFGGCITGEMYVAPLESILSHPVTAVEVPNFYERRWINNGPYHKHNRNKDRKWSAKYRLKGRTK